MNLSIGKKAPKQINVFIEIAQGSNIKYELDKKSGALFVDRFLYTAMNYPFNYGFVPETLAEDGDPLDCLVISSYPATPGTVLPSRVIGLLEMEDEEGIDTKLLAVPTQKIDPFLGEIEDVADLDDSLKAKIKHFFAHYKELEPGKWVKLKEWKSREVGLEAVRNAMER